MDDADTRTAHTPHSNPTASSVNPPSAGTGGEISTASSSVAKERFSTNTNNNPTATRVTALNSNPESDMDLPRSATSQDNRASTQDPAPPPGGVSTFRGPGGSPILERSSPILHRPYQSTSSASSAIPAPDPRHDSASVSPVLTRQQDTSSSLQQQGPLRMLPPPSPPTQRHPQYTGMDLPPLSSLTTGLPHRPPSSSMSISNMLGSTTSSPGDMSMHSHSHHHHSSHHHHHPRPPPRPYTPEYGNPLAPSSSSSTSNPLVARSQSTPATPAIGVYPENEASGHGRSSSYGRMPTSQQGPLPTPFRDTMYRGYMGGAGRNPPLPPREDYPPRQSEPPPPPLPPQERAPSPLPPQSQSQHIPELPKPSSSSPYPSHQGKHAALNTGIPPPQAPTQHSHSHSQPTQRQQDRQESSTTTSRPPATNGHSRISHHHHHHQHRPASQPSRLTPSRPPPKLRVNNTPALEAVANLPRPFLGRYIYEPGWIIPATIVEENVGGTFEVRIPHRFLGRDNEALKKRKLWGTGVYTDDSDVVAILYHTSTLPQGPLSGPKDMAAHFLVLPTLQHYAPSTLNELRSRGWKIHDGYSIYLDHWEWIPLGSAEGGRRARKRRIDEEYRTGVDAEEVGVLSMVKTGEVVAFKELDWNLEGSKRPRIAVA